MGNLLSAKPVIRNYDYKGDKIHNYLLELFGNSCREMMMNFDTWLFWPIRESDGIIEVFSTLEPDYLVEKELSEIEGIKYLGYKEFGDDKGTFGGIYKFKRKS